MAIAYGVRLGVGSEFQEIELALENEMKRGVRSAGPTKILIDWSGNEMNAEEFLKLMEQGQSGTHFYIDHEGKVTQFVDAGAFWVQRCSSKEIDQESIWITMQNRGRPSEDGRVPRGVFKYTFGKHVNVSVLCCNGDQLEALKQLLELLCLSTGLPACIPRRNEEPVERTLGKGALSRWEGILLASHIDERIVAPGPQVLSMLDELEVELYEGEEDDEEDPGDPLTDAEADAAYPEPG